jgi:N-acetyl-gamma-glutamyl-phosphate reductase
MISAAIVGVSGYAGGELARLLAQHPEVEITYVSSGTYAGQPLAKAFPGLGGTKAGKLICQEGKIVAAAQAADARYWTSASGSWTSPPISVSGT